MNIKVISGDAIHHGARRTGTGMTWGFMTKR